MPEMPRRMVRAFHIGDVLTINGLYADGTMERSDTPPTHYRNAPQQKWRVKAFDGDDLILQPLNDDGSVQQFRDATGDYRIPNAANQMIEDNR